MADTTTSRRCRQCCFIFLDSLFLTFSLVACWYFFTVFNEITTLPLSKYPTLQIDSIRVSNLNISNPISAHWNINMNVAKYDHNDISFEFNHDIKISIFHESKNEALWMVSLEPFSVRPDNPTAHFVLDFWGSSANVDDTTLKNIVEKIVSHGAVKFEVQFDAKLGIRLKNRIEYLRWNTNINNMLVSSCNVDLFFGSLDNGRAEMLRYRPYDVCTHQVF